MSNTNFRRYKTAEASRVLQELGAPRSKHTLRKDHRKQSGESGPRFVRDTRGTTFYWHTELETWAAHQRALLSPDNLPPESIKVARAALESRRTNPKALTQVVVADSTAIEKTRKNERVLARVVVGGAPSDRSGSMAGLK